MMRTSILALAILLLTAAAGSACEVERSTGSIQGYVEVWDFKNCKSSWDFVDSLNIELARRSKFEVVSHTFVSAAFGKRYYNVIVKPRAGQ